MARTTAATARKRNVGTWVKVAVVAAIGAYIGLAFRVMPPGPPQLLQESMAAAGAVDAFHYRAVWRSDGVSQIVVGDVRPSSGSETVSVGHDQFIVVFTGQEAYFDGNAVALQDQLGLLATTASDYAGRWISLQPSDGPYPSIEDGLTSSSALAQVFIAPFATAPRYPTGAVPLTQISGRIPHGQVVSGWASLDLISRSKLPTEYSAHGSNGGQPWSSTIAFSRWGENVVVSAPIGALSFSSLQPPAPQARVGAMTASGLTEPVTWQAMPVIRRGTPDVET